MKVSVVIPVYNEEKVIGDCLKSLSTQSYQDLEVIVVDDGSTDKTLDVLSEFKNNNLKLTLLKQDHLGAGAARNLGARETKGDILVFVDADMVFDREFIERLIGPIREGNTIGTFSKEEYVLNKDNVWSKCWNINRNLPEDRMHPKNYPARQTVFRAILKKEFAKVDGFETIGYVDDHTLADKLGVLAVLAPGAVFYHRNPESLTEIYRQARWIGKSEFKKRKISNENWMRLVVLIRYSFPLSLFFF
ncbi:MAG: hypothetical protein UU29_C0008G0120 [Candidatus Daviesbacteria bacterium GW2011_GWA2_40_9]|uniref:Glycosyltransferase 2-like domain-containing protein n=1 Tax=Candidatus Daviesbacteria bacterium GW2011_GWA2_40_9 TaxID=1618424 RepID=A0A0G0U731_9BACT|nr:MAG: hypothetical protein UU29_C0008G0120 [Candidatus Daviesbacteria bacterium GW2011_GWA2_40_9]